MTHTLRLEVKMTAPDNEDWEDKSRAHLQGKQKKAVRTNKRASIEAIRYSFPFIVCLHPHYCSNVLASDTSSFGFRWDRDVNISFSFWLLLLKKYFLKLIIVVIAEHVPVVCVLSRGIYSRFIRLTFRSTSSATCCSSRSRLHRSRRRVHCEFERTGSCARTSTCPLAFWWCAL